MCLLTLQKRNAKTLNEDILQTSFENNNDGAGLAYADNGKIHVRKYRDFTTFNDDYQKLHKKHRKSTAFLLHFRIGTHGSSEGTTNVHPFFVNDNLVFAHNGVINNVRDDKKLSDTQVFNNDYLKQLPKFWIKNNATLRLISEFIGHSKLAFLDSKGGFKIVNKHLGHWDGKTWFSNNSYKPHVFDFGGCTTTRVGWNRSSALVQQSKSTATPKYYGSIGTNYGSGYTDIEEFKPEVNHETGFHCRYEKDNCDECGQVSHKLRQKMYDTDDSWYCGVCWKEQTRT
tara:strand:+ start:375 stop:1229 length:855 start_codon:yes stop_codon:yes gene_type:complete